MQEIIKDYLRTTRQPATMKDLLNLKKLYGNPIFQSLYCFVRDNSNNAEMALNAIVNDLEQMDILKACSASHLCGALVEAVGTGETGKPLIDFYSRVVSFACEYLEHARKLLGGKENLDEASLEKVDVSKMFETYPEQTKAFFGCDLLTLAVMSVIVQDRKARLYLRSKGIYQQLVSLQDYIENVSYVTEVYNTCTDFKIIVLAPSVQKGFIMKVNDIGNCFHLFTLLEAELYKKGLAEEYQMENYELSDEIYRFARGEERPEKSDSINAHFQYYSIYALQKDGSYKMTRVGEDGTRQVIPESLIWGEMPPEAIPHLEGQAVMLIDKKGMFANRSWDVGFVCKCHDELNPFVQIIKNLSPEEVASWIEKIHHNQ